MKKMLMLGGSHAEIPMIQAARKMGYYVITTGNQESGLGHPYADEYVNCDFSDKEAIYRLATEKKVDAICSGCNDFAALSAAYAAEKMRLPGHDSYETALQIHHKDKYRALAERIGIHTPRSYRCTAPNEIDAICSNITFPVIVKPVDLTGGKGMMRCDDVYQVKSAVANAMKVTRQNYVIIEEFVTGTNHGFSAYIQNGRVTFYFVDNEQYYHNPYLVSGASAPGDVPLHAIEQLCKDCNKIAQELSLADGILHIQFILTRTEEPVIIEVCRRAPGDLYIQFVQMATGIDYPHYIVAAEAGVQMEQPGHSFINGYYVRHCVMADETGIIDSVTFAPEIKPYIVDSLMWYQPGEEIEDNMKYKAGIVFLHFEQEEKYREYIGRLTELIKIKVKR